MSPFEKKEPKYSIADISVGDQVMPYEDWLNNLLDAGNGRDTILDCCRHS